jgi:DNA repair protein RadC
LDLLLNIPVSLMVVGIWDTLAVLWLYEIKGTGDAKIIRLAAVLEIARRAAYGLLDDSRKKTPQK